MKLLIVLLIALQVNAAKLKVKFASVAPKGTPWAQTLEDIKKRVKKESKGDILVKTYLGGQLGGELESIQKIRRGNIQGGGITCAALASVVKELDVLELPYLFESYEQADYVLDNYLYEYFKKLFAQKDLILVSWAENGWRNIGHKSKLIKNPNDLKGEKMRSQESKVHLAFWKTLQAAPQAIAVPEVLPALQTGVVQGFDNTPLFTLAAEWHTAIKFFSITKHIYQPGAVVYGKKLWDKASEKQKKILLGNANGLAPEARMGVRALGDELVSVLKSQGIEVYELSKKERKLFADKLIPIHKGLLTQIGGSANEVYDLILKGKKEFSQK